MRVMPRMDLKEFENFYEPVSETGCWIWLGGTVNERGYGVCKRRPFLHKKAHRVSWTLHYGEIPKYMDVLHKCDTPICVNPKHLYIGTTSDNANDREVRGRGRRQIDQNTGRFIKVTQ